MLDLETLDTEMNPVIIQISAVQFDLASGNIERVFNEYIDPKSCIEKGLKTSNATIEWWLTQSYDAKKVLVAALQEGKDLTEVLTKFTDFIDTVREQTGEIRLWGNGVLSDNVWLKSAYKACNLPEPFFYNEHQDVRTLVDLHRSISNRDLKKEIVFTGTAHNALCDCEHQIKYCSAIYNHLKNGNTTV